MDLSASSLVAQPSLSPRERQVGVKTSMKKRISSKKGEKERLFIEVFFNTVLSHS